MLERLHLKHLKKDNKLLGELNMTDAVENSEGTVLDISEKLAEIRAVEAEESMKALYGEDKIKPFSAEQAEIMGSWGYKKRWRFAELMDLGKNTLEAYDLVENHLGKIID